MCFTLRFLGYQDGYKGYKVLDLHTNMISISRNVIFHETTFPFSENFPLSSASDIFGQHVLPLPVPDSPFPALFDLGTFADASFLNPVEPLFVPPSSSDVPTSSSVSSESVILCQRNKRQTEAPAYLDQYHCY